MLSRPRDGVTEMRVREPRACRTRIGQDPCEEIIRRLCPSPPAIPARRSTNQGFDDVESLTEESGYRKAEGLGSSAMEIR